MSTQSQIDRLNQAKNDIKTSITNKGVTVPSTTKIDGMSSYIDAISASEDLSAELTKYGELNADLETVINSLPEAGGGGGGGAIETVTGTLICMAPTQGGVDVVYTDGLSGALTASWNMMQEVTITVQKYSIVSVRTWTSYSDTSGGVALIGPTGMYAAFYVTDDFTLTYN